MFRDIDGNLATLSFVELGSKGEASPTLSENRKSFPDFGKKGPDYEVPFIKGCQLHHHHHPLPPYPLEYSGMLMEIQPHFHALN